MGASLRLPRAAMLWSSGVPLTCTQRTSMLHIAAAAVCFAHGTMQQVPGLCMATATTPCRHEVERFRDATGKDVGALEAEKAARSHLESRSKAQVRVTQSHFVLWGSGGLKPLPCTADAAPPRMLLVRPSTPTSAPQAELNTNLHEQVVLLREQKELSEARADKSGAEAKKLTAKVRLAGPDLGALVGLHCCFSSTGANSSSSAASK